MTAVTNQTVPNTATSTGRTDSFSLAHTRESFQEAFNGSLRIIGGDRGRSAAQSQTRLHCTGAKEAISQQLQKRTLYNKVGNNTNHRCRHE